jgi:hypothetical protein
MGSWAPAPSTAASFLLALDERAADGVVPLGGRRIALRRGRVVHVSRAEGDRSVAEFLRATGRIDEATLSRVAPLGETQALVAALALPAETVHDAIRHVWLDRLVRALGAPVAPPTLLNETPDREAGATEISLGLLVLDALERLSSSDAEEVGARAAGFIEWVEGPFVTRAQRWLGVDGKRARRVSGVLTSRPGAAARLAALARAGLVRVREEAADGETAPHVPEGPPDVDMRESLPPVKPPSLELAPGAAPLLTEGLQSPAFELPRFPSATAKLEDPLEPAERRVARAEESGASPAERARAWRAFGEAWLRIHGAIEETARCFREAAAADKTDVDLLQRTAEACAGAGQLDVALAYGRAAVAASASPDARGAALLWYALFCRRFDRPSDALGAARAAQAVGDPKPEAYALAAELEESHHLATESTRDLLEAATLARESHPDRAHAWLARAWILATHEQRAADGFSASLAARGQVEAALAVRATTARLTTDLDQRRRTLLSLAERAELAEKPLLAVDFQLEVLESEPLLEVVHDSVEQDLESAGLTVERALVLEDLAFRGEEDNRAELSLRAAEARMLANLHPEWTLVLVRRALETGASLTRARVLLDTLRTSQGDALICDVLEDVAYRRPEGTERKLFFDLLLQWGGGLPRGARRLAQAMRERAVPAPSGLENECAAEEGALASAEARRERSSGSAQRAATLEVAHLLSTTHAGRTRALALIESVLADVPSDDAEDLALRISVARGDSEAILRCAARLGARGGSAEKRQRALHLALAAACERGDAKAGREAALRLVRLEPESAETVLRMRRLGAREGDTELLAHGLRGESTLPLLSNAARARAFARLAALALENGATPQAARAAEEALNLHPTEGHAALIGLRAILRGESSVPLIARVQAVLGELPALLAAAARGRAEAADSLAATVTWASLEPTSPEPPLTALEECLARGIDDYLEPGLHALLTDARATPKALTAMGRAITRMAERGEVARAAELARRAAMYFGPAGAALRQMALDLGRRDGDPFHERAAMELLLPPREAVVSRVEHLEKIAILSRRAGDRAAEIRTLLRVLSAAPREPKTIDRLAQLFAETGETSRLFATLELLTHEGTEAERARGLLSLAAASTQLLGSESKTSEYLDRLAALPAEGASEDRALARADALVALGRVQPAIDLLVEEAKRSVRGDEGAAPSSVGRARTGSGKLYERAADLALRHLADPEHALAIAAEGLRSGGVWTGRTLLVFEQLALEKEHTELAEDVYRDLIRNAMGDRGRRALAYRRARWLERRGDKRAALDVLVDACSKAGASGAVATALERVARDLGDLDALARGYIALAAAAKHPVLRGGLVQRAVRIWEEETGHPERAFDALVGEWKKTFSSEIEPDLARLANAVAEGNPVAGAAAYQALFTEIERHAADAWMGEEKARLLMKAARLHAARGAVDEAVNRAHEAIAALVADDADAARVAEVWTELARFEELRGARGAAQIAVRSALSVDPTHEGALALAKKIGAELPAAPEPAPARAPSVAPSASSPPPEPALEQLTPEQRAPGPEDAEPRDAEPQNAEPQDAEPQDAEPQDAELQDAARAAEPASEESAAVDTGHPTTNGASASEVPSTGASEPPGRATLESIAMGLDVDAPSFDLTVSSGTPAQGTFVPRAPLSPLAVPEMFVDDSDLPARTSRLDLWSPASRPPGAARPPSLPPLAPVRNSLPPPGEGREEFAARLARDPSTRAGAASVLRGMLMESPSRFDVLVQLAEVSGDAPELAMVHRVASGLLSLTSATAVPAPTSIDPSAAAGLVERLTQPGALSASFAILERLAEAMPLYRQTLAQHGVVGTDRVAVHGASPIARALAAVTQHRTVASMGATAEPRASLPSLDTPVFVSSRPGGIPSVLRTTPASVLLPIDWSKSDLELRFAIGRAVELAQPRAVLLATLPEAEAATLFDAVRAAFGPADSGRVDKNAAQLASELWRSLPVRVQRDVRELVAQAGGSWDVSAVRAAALATSSRVGLIACGDVRSAVGALLRARRASDVGIGTGEAWQRILSEDAELADLVRVALSDDFLGALQ